MVFCAFLEIKSLVLACNQGKLIFINESSMMPRHLQVTCFVSDYFMRWQSVMYRVICGGHVTSILLNLFSWHHDVLVNRYLIN